MRNSDLRIYGFCEDQEYSLLFIFAILLNLMPPSVFNPSVLVSIRACFGILVAYWSKP
jgi:hypothetical protein